MQSLLKWQVLGQTRRYKECLARNNNIIISYVLFYWIFIKVTDWTFHFKTQKSFSAVQSIFYRKGIIFHVVEAGRDDFLHYLILMLTGVQDCVNRVSPLAVVKRENFLTQFASMSCITLLLANARLVATSCSTAAAAFLHELGTLTTAADAALRLPSVGFLSSVTFSTTATDTAPDTFFGLPRNGSSRSSINACININRLFMARSENRALILPLAPDVSIKVEEDDDGIDIESICWWRSWIFVA